MTGDFTEDTIELVESVKKLCTESFVKGNSTDLPNKAVVNVTVLAQPAPVETLLRIPCPCDEDEVTVYNGENTCLRFCPDGRVYVRGNLVDTDREVYDGIRELLGLAVKPAPETRPPDPAATAEEK